MVLHPRRLLNGIPVADFVAAALVSSGAGAVALYDPAMGDLRVRLRRLGPSARRRSRASSRIQVDIPPGFVCSDRRNFEADVLRHPWLDRADWAVSPTSNIGSRVTRGVRGGDRRGHRARRHRLRRQRQGARWHPAWNGGSMLPFLERLPDAGLPARCREPRRAHAPPRRSRRLGHAPGGDGWVPTFTGASDLYGGRVAGSAARSSPASATDVYGDSIAPIIEAGLADVIDVRGADLGHGLRLEPTPGHTPGHTSMWIESRRRSTRSSPATSCTTPLQVRASRTLAEIADADVERRPLDSAAHAPRDGADRSVGVRCALPEPPRRPSPSRRRRLALRRSPATPTSAA